ncbi:MAG: RNA polymerase sigma factor [Flammeovirgaceae bacterium]|jgi:RNA polymerase sigma-70 factor (ECF subfamily)|nr:RNA polymerase sigma factor [Flammeovirgaceae bacterium]
MTSTTNETHWITQAQKGDKQAFRYLVDAYYPFVFNLAFRYLGNQADAEDVVQEACVKWWRHFAQFKHQAKLSTWLYALTLRTCMDYTKTASYKKRKRQQPETHAMQIASTETPAKMLEANELAERFKKAAETLSEKQKTVFVLKDLQDFTTEETMQISGQTEEQIKSNLFHARKQVSMYMKMMYQTPEL